MKNILLTYGFIFIYLFNFSQIKRGTIVIRRNITSDTLIKYTSVIDSSNNTINIINRDENKSSSSVPLEGRENVWFSNNKIYFINKDFNSNRKEFLRKLKKREKKNKLHFFNLNYSITTTDTIKKSFFSVHEITNIYFFDKNDSLVIIDSKDIIDSNFQKKEETTQATNNHLFLSTINLNLYDSTKNITRLNDLILLFLWQNPEIKWTMSSVKTIYKDNYKIEFNINNLSESIVKIIKNNTEEYICYYKIKNKFIYIENPPIAELSKGKFNSRKTSLVFKIHNSKHIFNLTK